MKKKNKRNEKLEKLESLLSSAKQQFDTNPQGAGLQEIMRQIIEVNREELGKK